MLQKSQTLPVISAGSAASVSKKECLDITTKCTQVNIDTIILFEDRVQQPLNIFRF